ncbi:site-2 protease family protein [Pseudanabaena sp. FACHB-2040]|uniref:site-2 protease family protein n=1 Tax=Pseudanabaena sp. FACHB-2040 TaxID=2692859 RepID=UPI00168410D1|nr:site-2 protease family protein [Pseudanabaena sp. FACHB-2040]MBD2259512.1 site-2 protease family protein [Pseudanabaena sp. FACHB-2040]
MVVTGLILLAAIAILTVGFLRARPYGKVGLLAWLQSVVLMAPWLLFFTLVALGLYLNLAGVLLLLVTSTGLYIYLGRQLRSLGTEEMMAHRAAALTSDPTNEPLPETNIPSPNDVAESAAEKEPATPITPTTMPIPAEDLAAIEGIFGIDTYFRTETVPYQEGAIFRGNLRGEPIATHARLSASLAERVSDRYRLFLVENAERRPTVVVLPSSVDPPKTTPAQWVLAVALGIATIFTSLETGGILQGFDLVQTPEQWRQAVPIMLGVVVVLTAHEIGHWVVANRNDIRLSPPFLIPTWQIGSFGALTRFESLLPNRSVLFDIAFAGPAVGGVVSLIMLVLGLVLSHPGSLFQIPSQFFQGSVLVGTLAKVVLGSALQQPLVDVHPLTVIGWLGLVITALNLMPAGQLDGGRVVQAIYGRKTAGRTTFITLLVLVLVSLVNPLALYWAALILILQRNLERPSLNDLTEPDDARAALGLLALFLMLATLLPLTPSLAGRLGIGT